MHGCSAFDLAITVLIVFSGIVESENHKIGFRSSIYVRACIFSKIDLLG